MAIQQGVTDEWIKSSYSIGNGECVEVRSPAPASLGVRDSKVHDGPSLSFPTDAWNAFVASIKP
ncbi:DUF397 domain-containing protein [Streptomyces phaeolivaceus]|uniref:DUF397 domain-containing protein n=1 Tax=Streptomyces phaeolivaceus TaxID=2653200 RepID=A0A5P8K4U9_9ACTN|nr:DUF397 domain-containing protein [Streptomyces phaeolivaceus]QFQ98171.1 DUF397 domain-containing protein [Streptomyces phaeolivaceus]